MEIINSQPVVVTEEVRARAAHNFRVYCKRGVNFRFGVVWDYLCAL